MRSRHLMLTLDKAVPPRSALAVALYLGAVISPGLALGGLVAFATAG